MCDKFQIVHVADDAAHAQEPMGTKQKFWFHTPDGGQSLFKCGRPGTGENWAEKIVAELAGLLGLPHAQYELGTWRGRQGVVSPSFLQITGVDADRLQLVHGNEILMVLTPDYPEGKYYKVSQHTLERVFGFFVEFAQHDTPCGWKPLPGIARAADVFVGYLILDAWVGNTDRHHENWAFILEWQSESQVRSSLAPTFDHASSLGSHLTDKERKDRLTTRDKGYTIDAYVAKARSAFYDKEGDRKPLTTFEVALWCRDRHPQAVCTWLDRLGQIGSDEVLAVLQRVPETRISKPGLEFSHRMLSVNQRVLLRLREQNR